MSDLLNSASLVMIPSGYKEDTVYSVVPSDGSGDLSFTRASNGTRINSQGVVEVCPWNLVEQSETLSASPWGTVSGGTASAPVITANDTTAPNGTMTADKVVFDTGAGTSGTDRCTIYQDILNQPIGIYTASIYAKVASGTAKIIMRSAGGGQYTTLNLTTEWQRFEVPETNSVFGTVNIEIGLRRGLANEPLTSPVTCYLWGAQLNIGSTAKPYFPTTDRLNVPRLTYQNGGGGCPSLLLEKQSTNLVVQSNDMTTWANGGGTMTKNAATSPDGTNNALSFDNTADCSTFAGASNGVYSWSVYVKQGTSPTASIDMSDGATGDVITTFTFATKTFSGTSSGGQWTSPSTSYIECGNGWFRITLIATKNAGSSIGHKIIASGSGYTYVYGAQLELGSYPTSYIPTTSSSATRVLDECSKTGISSLIGQTEGVLFVDFVFTAYDYDPKWVAFLGGGASYIGIYTQSTPEFVCEIANSGVPQFFSNTYVFSVGQRYKLAIAYKANDFAFYVNGTQVATDSSGTVPATSQFSLQYNTATANLTSRIYNQVALFPTRLTNAQLASLTTI